ncbi:AbgT family transporter [Parendozoicomonas haliclonae]|uniref:p-aminobenzoyl-glutamate transport protein n=1 Tax=Parendozoicomonas haliclonae TaxID=1960125 RepID=A0A1X7AG30_9GAMM|nr:AbgT family transporter [Parendozoicomonas haliclonae]SMA31980.1 p-aminobenzoyl-glutamate transport protein [Parendozoicomonas haliclonae]
MSRANAHSSGDMPNKSSFTERALNFIERNGNRLPTPAMLFLYCLAITFVVSWVLSMMTFDMINPRTGEAIVISNLLSGSYLAGFLASLVKTFISFPPLGVVLIAILGVGVAEESGYINTALKKMLNLTPAKFITPVVVLIGAISSIASDAGYVLVIPMGGIIFHAAGRHPIAGLASAFAGVSGGFSAGLLPSPIDPMIQGFTQAAAQTFDPAYLVNPLCNFFFTFSSTFLIGGMGWYVTDKIVEPRLNKNLKIDENIEESHDMSSISEDESRGFRNASLTMLGMFVLLILACLPETSPLRNAAGSLTDFNAPLMGAIVPLIFIIFLVPAIIYGRTTGKYKNAADVIDSMSNSLVPMTSYMIMAFFCALFLKAFGDSNLGTLIALSGAELLQALNMPGQLTIIGIILLTGVVNLFIGSLSAKWALIGPIVIPMLMTVGISPELAQAAYRVGDSSTNIITPMMVYFPLVVVFFQRYNKNAGLGTVASTMLPYSITFLIGWTAFLLLFWAFDLPLGFAAPYNYVPAG